ncbi:hypothetical protein AWB80_05181 [Caballeronia pedi]|uniref:Uncharacterized protein n=1 Tax=Caballeronia pedi TaxID=1777141 RepID=A0A158CG36_9BURK|nr:hypothetical protein AWB80_05181 [Caballeronia pedi]
MPLSAVRVTDFGKMLAGWRTTLKTPVLAAC